MLNEIKTLLNIEVKLMEMKLENGTIVSAEAFEKGNEIFIVTDDEKVAMPVGEYILEDGKLLVVEEEGMIADMREVSDEAPAKEEDHRGSGRRRKKRNGRRSGCCRLERNGEKNSEPRRCDCRP